jgi:Fe-S cluster assembly scaffold protein SufB
MLDKIFESLDDKVFTPELKEAMEAKFNEAVEAQAIVIAESKITEKTDYLNEKAEEHIEFLNDKAEEYVELKQAEMVESLDKYLERVVDEFIGESKEALGESLKAEKADLIIEAFESMLIAAGVKVSTIVEAKDSTDVENELTETVQKYDSLVEENIGLKDENDILIKAGVIMEMKEGLSLVESEKFEKLADIVDFSRDESFKTKLTTIKESVKITAEVKDDKKDEPVITENWSHLV